MSAPLWLPGATVVKAANDGGSMVGSDAYVTWHTFECDYNVSAVAGARALNANGDSVHLTFNPVTGELAQMLPANRAGRGLLNAAGGVETNRQGRVNIQIEVIGRASRPWTQDLTAAGRASLVKILNWLDDLGVPRMAPNGFVGPTTYAASTKRARSLAAWNGPGGYFCHADVPENDHWDHGAIDMRDLWAVTTPEVDMPSTAADAKTIVTSGVFDENPFGPTPAPVSVAYILEKLAAMAIDNAKKVDALAAQVARPTPAQPTAPTFTDADITAIATKVTELLAKRLES